MQFFVDFAYLLTETEKKVGKSLRQIENGKKQTSLRRWKAVESDKTRKWLRLDKLELDGDGHLWILLVKMLRSRNDF